MATPKHGGKIYTKYEVTLINFYATMLWFVPMVLVITYVFEIDQLFNINRFIFWLAMSNLFGIVVGTFVLLFRRDHLRRQIKPNYQTEFIYLLFISSFGMLGFIVFYDYMGFDRQYIANVLVIVGAILLYILLQLSRKIFKFDFMKRN